jgi:hypothetical protein
MGSQEFQNAFARAQIERANALNPLLAFTAPALKQPPRCQAQRAVRVVRLVATSVSPGKLRQAR